MYACFFVVITSFTSDHTCSTSIKCQIISQHKCKLSKVQNTVVHRTLTVFIISTLLSEMNFVIEHASVVLTSRGYLVCISF